MMHNTLHQPKDSPVKNPWTSGQEEQLQDELPGDIGHPAKKNFARERPPYEDKKKVHRSSHRDT